MADQVRRRCVVGLRAKPFPDRTGKTQTAPENTASVTCEVPGYGLGNRMRAICIAFLFTLLSMLGSDGPAAQERKIDLEFNDLQQSDAGCRAVFVLRNALGKSLDQLTLRVVAFDSESHANLFLSLDVGAMPASKTRVLRFDLGDGIKCGDVSRLVLDDVIDCKGGDMDPPKCLAAVSLSSRAGVPFDF